MAGKRRTWQDGGVLRLPRSPFLRRPWLMLGMCALLAGALLLRWRDLHVSSQVRVLLEGDSRNLATYEKVESILGDTEVVAVDLEQEALFTQAGLDAVRRISEAFAAEPDVLDVKSLTHSAKPVRQGLSFAMVPFVPAGELAPAELEELRRFCRTHPLVRNIMVSADGRHTMILVTYRGRVRGEQAEEALSARVDRVLAPFRAEGLRLWALGLPLAAEEVRATLRSDLGRLLPIGLGLLLLVCWLTFRSGIVLLLVAVQQLVALGCVPGLIVVSGVRVSLFSLLALPLLAGVQLTLLAHVFSGLRRGFGRSAAPEAALAQMWGEVFKPSLFAALTTLTGLLSLTTSEVAQVRDFGKVGALGLGFVFLLTFGPGMSLLKLVIRRRPRGWAPGRAGAGIGDPAEPTSRPPSRNTAAPAARDVTDRWVGWARQRRSWLLGGATLLVGAGLVAAGSIRTDIRAVEFLDPGSPTRQALETLDQAYGGVNVVQIEFDTGRTNGVNSLSFLKALDRVHEETAALPGASGVYSYASLLAMMNQIWEGGRPEALRLPPSPLVLGLFVVALRSYDYPFLTALADPSGRVAYLVVRSRDMPASAYLDMIHRVEERAKALMPPEVKVSAAAGLHTILEADRRILRSQTRSLWLTLASIGVALALLWRSIRLALLVITLNLLPVLLAALAAALTGVPLNSLTVMVAAVTLGLAVDDAIHLVTQWRTERAAGLDRASAMAAALRVKARPIVWTSVILVTTFLLLCGSSFPPVRHFGALGALALGAAVLLLFGLLPACLGGGPPRQAPRDKGAGRPMQPPL